MNETNPFWQFSLELYARDGVAPCCLALQDAQGVDVNVLLFCLWRAAQGEVLNVADLAELDASMAGWRSGVVQPLRQLRRDLSAYPDAASTRDMLKQAELESERVQQGKMWRWQLGRAPAAPAGPAEALSANLAAYAGLLEIDPASLADLDGLVRRILDPL